MIASVKTRATGPLPRSRSPTERGRRSSPRMTKLSGVRWTVAGADATIALRCREASSNGKASATRRTTRQEPPDQPALQDDLDHLQNWRTPAENAGVTV